MTQVAGQQPAISPREQWSWGVGREPAYTPRRTTLDAERIGRSGFEQSITLSWFHRYPARFAADVVAHLLTEVLLRAERPVRSVIDPFCGTGALVAACRQVGIPATGLELTQLGVLVGKLRLDPPTNPWDVAALCEEIGRGHTRAAPADVTPELVTWLGNDNANLLGQYLTELENITDLRTSRFVTVALSQALRSASCWLAGSVKPTTDPNRVPTPLAQSVRRAARQLARDCDAEQDALARPGDPLGLQRPAGHIVLGDARTLPCADASVDAIVTSPPYFVTYDYYDVQRLSYLAFGWPVHKGAQMGAKYGNSSVPTPSDFPEPFDAWYSLEFRREKTVLGRALRVYVEAMQQHLKDAYRVVRPGGIVAYSLANTVRHGKVFDLVTGFASLLREAGFTDITVEPRQQSGRRILPAGRNDLTGRFSSDSGRAGLREMVVFAYRPCPRGSNSVARPPSVIDTEPSVTAKLTKPP